MTIDIEYSTYMEIVRDIISLIGMREHESRRTALATTMWRESSETPSI